jgi:hypothetical protein
MSMRLIYLNKSLCCTWSKFNDMVHFFFKYVLALWIEVSNWKLVYIQASFLCVTYNCVAYKHCQILHHSKRV